MNTITTTSTTKSLGLQGPVELKAGNIDNKIKGRSPGNYALGRIEEKAFIVAYVGRSDTDLNSRLKDWVGDYPYFKWSYASSEKVAYNKECKNYHDFGENRLLDNISHPAKPDGKDWKCEVCGE